jgi:hypothetical protein
VATLAGFEPAASRSTIGYSPIELQRPGAGSEDRTRISTTAASRSTVEPCPRVKPASCADSSHIPSCKRTSALFRTPCRSGQSGAQPRDKKQKARGPFGATRALRERERGTLYVSPQSGVARAPVSAECASIRESPQAGAQTCPGFGAGRSWLFVCCPSRIENSSIRKSLVPE